MDGKNLTLIAHDSDGDNTGRVTVKETQGYHNTLNRVLQKFSLFSQKNSEVRLPPEFDCRDVDIYVKGKRNKNF